MSGLNLIAVSVGNTRTRIGQFLDGQLREAKAFDNDALPDLVQHVLRWWEEMSESSMVLIASVNGGVARSLKAMIGDQLSIEVYHVGDDIPVPIGRRLDPETITGIDRLLNAAAAYDRIRQACIVIDAGTAVTVDFVDGEGTFHGGAIFPGATMQMSALHERTSGLPDLPFAAPDDEAFGRSTSQAMLKGVFHGIRGAVQRLAELYAEDYGAYPQIIATGGDAEVLFAEEGLVDNIVPDLSLLGIATAARHALAGGEVEGSDG